VAVAFHYSDDEPGSPWTWILYLDAGSTPPQRTALEAIFTRDGSFPWLRAGRLEGVRVAAIEADHTRRRQRLRVRDHLTLRIREPFATTATVTCGIPGHDQLGEELIADELAASDGPLDFTFNGVCGFAADFSYTRQRGSTG
jgi:hypothetical protein